MPGTMNSRGELLRLRFAAELADHLLVIVDGLNLWNRSDPPNPEK